MNTIIAGKFALPDSPWKATFAALVMMVAVASTTFYLKSILKTLNFLDGLDIEHISMLYFNAGMLTVALLIYRNMRRVANVSSRPNGYWLLSGALAGIGFACVFILLTFFIDDNNKELYFNGLSTFTDDIRSLHAYTLIMMLVTMHVLIPMMEETLFRGILFQVITIRLGKYAGIIGSAFLFALIHLGSIFPFMFIFILFFGASSAYFMHSSGKLTASYSMHIIYNVCITIYSYIYGSVLSTTPPG